MKGKIGRHGNRGSGSQWRPCHEPGLRLGVSCGRELPCDGAAGEKRFRGNAGAGRTGFLRACREESGLIDHRHENCLLWKRWTKSASPGQVFPASLIGRPTPPLPHVMRNKYTLSLLVTALGLALIAIIYDANFAGIPFQDATREQVIAYAKHSKVCAGLMFASGAIVVLSLIAAMAFRAANRKTGSMPGGE